MFLVDKSDLIDDHGYGKESCDLELPMEQVVRGGVFYNIYRNQEVVVAGLARNIKDVVIKSKINSKKVTKIGIHTFAGTAIRSITFDPDSAITKINASAFYNYRSLTSVTLPNSLTSIGGGSFSGCKALKEITLPNGLTDFHDSVFYNCSSLTNITLPDSLTSLGDYCFCDCRSLKEITLPNSLTTIECSVFAGCTSLQQINLGNDSQLKDLS